ncbi:MAG: PLP-dependent aminotransferase family protein [Clostridiales bacterium]|nr:PLP-dependent aminotransferase family protein [Clostridiales bacterium]
MKLFFPDLDRKSSVPLYIQLYEYIRREIESGGFKPCERMPSSRSLAKHLNLSKNTVDSAYHLLKTDNLIISAERSGFFAAPDSFHPKYTTETDPNAVYLYNFSIHGTDISRIPYNKWNKAVSDLCFADPLLLDHGSRTGDFSFRTAISEFLRETSGISCSPHNIVLGAGLEYLLQILDKLLGRENIWGFENPGYLNHYEILNNGAGSVRLLDIASDGFNPSELESSDIKTLYLIPEHQIPTGRFIPLRRRREILHWAGSSSERYIIENGYDALLKYGRENTPSLFSLDKNGSVIYINSFSRIIAPSVRLAFMILPDELLERFKTQNRFYRCLVSRHDQAVVTELIKSGLLTSYISTARNLYKEKRELAVSFLQNSPIASRIKIFNSGGGTHFLLSVSSALSAEKLREKAAEKKIKILPLRHYMIKENCLFPENTFVLGFGGLSKTRLADALGLLIEAWSDC